MTQHTWAEPWNETYASERTVSFLIQGLGHLSRFPDLHETYARDRGGLRLSLQNSVNQSHAVYLYNFIVMADWTISDERQSSVDEQFNSSGSFREQCFHACRILRTQYQPAVPYSLIGKLFHVDKATIRKEWKRFMKDADQAISGGRPPILTAL
jgi:hypothetical protein